MSRANDERLQSDLRAAYGRNLPGEEFDRRVLDRIDLDDTETELSVPALGGTRLWPWIVGAAAVLLIVVGAPFAWYVGNDAESTGGPVGPAVQPRFTPAGPGEPAPLPPLKAVPAGEDAEQRLIVNLKKDGSIAVRGRTYSLEQLTGFLKAESASAPRKMRDDGRWVSDIQVVIRADHEIGWRRVQHVMQACADPAVRVFKVQFATTKDGVETVRESFLDGDQFPAPPPKDGEEAPPAAPGWPEIPEQKPGPGVSGGEEESPKLAVELKRTLDAGETRVFFLGRELGTGEKGFKALEEALAGLTDPVKESCSGEINAWAFVPHAEVVRAIDAFMAAGIADITFVGAPPPNPGKNQYVVQRGDTIWEIADRTLGDGSRWPEIVKANPGLAPDRLKVGQKLLIPSDEPDPPAEEVVEEKSPEDQGYVRVNLFLKDGKTLVSFGSERVVHEMDEALELLDRNLALHREAGNSPRGWIEAGVYISQRDYDRIMAVFKKHGVTDVILIR